MVDKKISQLPEATDLYYEDLFGISKSLGGGAYDSYKVKFEKIRSSIFGARTIFVDINGGSNATTIKEGLALASALVPAPSTTNPAYVQVAPGVYYEDNPITIPNFVTVTGIGGSYSTLISPINSGKGVIVGIKSKIQGFGNWPFVPNVIGISLEGEFSVAQDIIASNCETAFLCGSGSQSSVIINCAVLNLTFPPTTCENAYYCSGGSRLVIYSSLTNSSSGVSITNGLRCDGSSSIVYAYSAGLSECENGLLTENSGNIHLTGGNIYSGTNAIHISSTGGIVECTGAIISDMSQYDFYIESASGHLDYTGKFDSSKRSVVDGALVHAIGQDPGHGGSTSVGTIVAEGDVKVGFPGINQTNVEAELEVGEGGSYYKNQYGITSVEYWSYNASAVSGSRFTNYVDREGTQLADNGDALIIASRYPWSTVTIEVIVAMDTGANSVIVEYWNGASWVETTVASYVQSSLLHRANVFFQNVESQYVEMSTTVRDLWIADNNILDEIPAWITTTDMYAIRFRNIGVLTTPMQFRSGMVRGSDFEVASAFETIEWGEYRSTEDFTFPISIMSPNTTNPPQSTLINWSPNISETVDALFANGVVSATNFREAIPIWADTSSGVLLKIAYYATDINVGNVDFTVRYFNMYSGIIFDGTVAEYSEELITTTCGTPYRLCNVQYIFNISNFHPAMRFVISIERDATAGNDDDDTYTGDVVVLGATVNWTRKRV